MGTVDGCLLYRLLYGGVLVSVALFVLLGCLGFSSVLSQIGRHWTLTACTSTLHSIHPSFHPRVHPHSTHVSTHTALYLYIMCTVV